MGLPFSCMHPYMLIISGGGGATMGSIDGYVFTTYILKTGTVKTGIKYD